MIEEYTIRVKQSSIDKAESLYAKGKLYKWKANNGTEFYIECKGNTLAIWECVLGYAPQEGYYFTNIPNHLILLSTINDALTKNKTVNNNFKINIIYD